MVTKISKPQASILKANKPRNLFLAGQGGGKTYVMGLLSYSLVHNYPKAIGFIGANTVEQLSKATLMEIFKVWRNEFGITEYSTSNPNGSYVLNKEPPSSFVPHGHTFNTNHGIIFMANGAVIMTNSLENYKAIEGRTMGWAMLDETSDTREAAVKEVITGRLRQNVLYPVDNPTVFNAFTNIPNGNEPVNPLFIFTKPTKELWLSEFFKLSDHREEITRRIFSRTDFFEHIDDRRHIVISSAYHNARVIGKTLIETREDEMGKEMAEMYVYGSPFGRSGAEYYSAFEVRKHVRTTEIIEGLPLHISLDFNVNPYMTMIVCQIDDTGIYVHDEYAMKAPNNTIEDTLDAFLHDYEHLLDNGLYYYGDASGKANMPLKVAKDYYSIIKAKLSAYVHKGSRRLLKANPRHRSVGMNTLGRREFMNMFLRGKYGVTLTVNPKCKYTIQDLEYVKEDQNGAKLKEMAVINDVRCQKYGHHSDALDSIITYVWGQYNKEPRDE